MRRIPLLSLLLGAIFTFLGVNQAQAVNETRITAAVVSGVDATISWSTSQKQKSTVYQIEVIDKSKTKNNTNTLKTPSSKIVIKDLKAWNQYSVRIRAVVASRTYAWSKSVLIITTQKAISDLSVTSVSYRTASLTWGAIPGTSGYKIYLDGLAVSVSQTSNYDLKNLLIGKSYSVSVAAMNGALEGIKSTPLIFTTSNSGPQNFLNTSTTNTTTKFEWNAIPGVDDYELYLDDKLVERVKTNSYEFKNLVPGQAIIVKVLGRFGDQKTEATLSKANTQVVTPEAPTVTVINAISARVTWAQDLAAKNFIVNIYDGVKVAAVVTNTAVGTATSSVVTGLLPGTSYTATVTIDYGTATTSPSPVTGFTTTRPSPTGLTVSGITSTAATLTWDAVPGALRYEYSRDGLAGVNVANTTSATISSLSPGVSYSVRIRAVFITDVIPTSNVSEYSTAVTFNTLTDLSAKPTISSVPSLTVSSPYSGATAIVGASLVSTNGIWTATPSPSSYAYQWQRSYDGGTTWTNLQGATGSTYILVESDYGFKLRVGVTATNTNGSTISYSAASDVVGTISNIQIPIARGTLVVGQLLSATQGTWYSADPLSYSYAWLRNGSAISGATSATYTLVDADIGTSISVQVTARSSLGSLAATSAARGSVPAILNTVLPTVSGNYRTAETLTATNGTWLNSPGSYTYQWEQSAEGILWDPISGATSSTYVLASAQVGKVVRVQVKASKTVSSTAYTEVVYSAATTSISGTVTGLVISNTVAPVVSGSWTAGSTLSTTNGSWSATGTFTYKWQKSTDASTWEDISGATTSTYTIVSADADARVLIRSVVSINSSTGAGTVYSASTRKVGSPFNTVAAAVTGTLRVGSTQTTSNGTWSNSPTSYSYQWQSSTNGIAWTDIDAATTSSYAPTFAQANLQIRVIVSATNAVDTATVTSNVVSGFLPPEATAIPTISGTTTVGGTLTAASPGTWAGSPSAGSYAYQWQRSTDGVNWSNISAATATTYVLVTGDAGYLIRTQVSLSTNAGTSVAYSLATAAVASS